MSEESPKYVTGDAIESLKTKIAFPEEFALLDQDWEFVVTDASRLDELMQAYVELELNVEEKFTLMMIIAESYNDLLSACVIDPEELEPLRQILIKDFVIHKEGIRYWADTLKDGDKPEEAFPIAFLMKDILESQTAKRINERLEQSPSASKKSIAELKGLLQSLSTQEQMRLPEVLSKLAVERLYPIMRELELEPALQEHLIWGYFREKMSGVLVISDELMAEILQQHRDSQRIVAESLILTAIKEEKISLEQLQAIRRFFERNELLNRKPFEKETLAFVCREKVRSGNALQQQEVEQLLEAEAFSTVLFALQENKVETAALKLIQPPAAGEKNRKRKQAVFDWAQRQAKHN